MEVHEWPEVKDTVAVGLGSLEEVVKASEALLKPILHVAEPTRHTYCVIDGTTQYLYVHEIESPGVEALTTGSPLPKSASRSKISRLIERLRRRPRHAVEENSSTVALSDQAGNNAVGTQGNSTAEIEHVASRDV